MTKDWRLPMNQADQWHIRHAKQSTELHVNRYNPIVWSQSKQKEELTFTPSYKKHKHIRSGMAQWRECSPPINVSGVRLPYPSSFVSWVCCWFCTLLGEVFLRVLRFSPSNISKFQFDPGLHGHFCTSSCELLSDPWVNKLHYISLDKRIALSK